MKKMALISSWNEECGIASYSGYLFPEFKKYYDVEVLPLQTDILFSDRPNIARMGDKSIEEMRDRLKEFDCVNIQFEASLFGKTKGQVCRRLLTLVSACKNVIVTFHSIDLDGEKMGLRVFVSRHPIKKYVDYRRKKNVSNIYMSIFRGLKKMSKTRNIKILVHNERDRDKIKYISEFEKVYDFPLAEYNMEVRNRQKTAEEKEIFLRKYGLSSDDIVIGLFGFVSSYKGFDTALKALKELPLRYKIIIFGEQHPKSIEDFCTVDPFLKKILGMIDAMKLKERVIFAGTTSDEDFIEAMRYSDFVVLPYVEVKQMASAVAANALECKNNIIMSNTKCFRELEKYYPNCFKRFDIGNYYQLAYLISHWDWEFAGNIERCLEKYSVEKNVLNYVSLFENE